MEVDSFRPTCPTCHFISVRYRFLFNAVRGHHDSSMQLSRIVLYDHKGQPIRVVKTSSPSEDMRQIESPSIAASRISSSGVLPATVDLTLEAPTHVAAYELFTAVDKPGRDPVSWDFGALFADGTFVVVRSTARTSAPWARQTSYGYELLGSLTRPGATVPGRGVRGGARAGPAGNCSELLLLLLRGDTFRLGARGEQGASGAAPQIEVLRAIATNVMRPAVRMGWWVFPLADVSVAEHRIALFRNMTRDELLMDPRALRVHSRNGTQTLTVLEALRWTARVAGGLLRQAAWRSLLVLRADVVLKQRLRLPEPAFGTRSILVPFQVWDQPFTKLSHVPRVADNMIYVPRCRFAELIRALSSHGGQRNLHDLCDWLRGPVSYWVASRHDADSSRERNPLFRMVGRPEATTSCLRPPCDGGRERGQPCGWPPQSEPGEPQWPCGFTRCPRSTWEHEQWAAGVMATQRAFSAMQARSRMKAQVMQQVFSNRSTFRGPRHTQDRALLLETRRVPPSGRVVY